MNAVGPLVRVKAAPRARAETAARARAPAIAFFAVFIIWTGCRPVRFFGVSCRLTRAGRCGLLEINLRRIKMRARIIFLFDENKSTENA